MRAITYKYQDPLDLIWIHCARRLGWHVTMSREVYASWDGKNTLWIATPEDRDADDCVAQLIFHEICHALIAGEQGRQQIDWGLCNFDQRDLQHELACHRLQAGIAQRFDLRAFMAVTTEWRPYYDALPQDPLTQMDYKSQILHQADLQTPDHSIMCAMMKQVKQAYQEFCQPSWHDPITQALQHTQHIRQLLHLWHHAPYDAQAFKHDSLWMS